MNRISQRDNSLQDLANEFGETIDLVNTEGKCAEDAWKFAKFLKKNGIDSKIIENALAELAKEDNSLEALDKEWEEAAAFTGDAAEDCKTCNAFPNATESLQQMSGGPQ